MIQVRLVPPAGPVTPELAALPIRPTLIIVISERLQVDATLGRITPASIALYVFLWAMVAAVSTAIAFVATGGQSAEDWFRPFWPILIYWAIWALVTPIIYRIAARSAWNWRTTLAAVAAHVGLLLTVSLLGIVAVTLSDTGAAIVANGTVAFHAMNVPTYALIAASCHVLATMRYAQNSVLRAKELEVRASELDASLTAAKLAALRMQINPHFLLNSLNSIASLVQMRDTNAAYTAIENLGDLMTQALVRSRDSFVTLGQEADIVLKYIAIEELRFGERLAFREDIEQPARRALIPTLSVLPLVENAIKHGVAAVSRPVTVELSARIRDDRLMIAVVDSGAGLPKGRNDGRQGYGTANVAERLRLVYGSDFEFSIKDLRNRAGVESTMCVPLDFGESLQ